MNDTNSVLGELNIVWTTAEKFCGHETDAKVCQWDRQLDDFGLPLRPACDWLISFWLSADIDKTNRVCIDHSTMIICPDINGQLVANDKGKNLDLLFFWKSFIIFYSDLFPQSF